MRVRERLVHEAAPDVQQPRQSPHGQHRTLQARVSAPVRRGEGGEARLEGRDEGSQQGADGGEHLRAFGEDGHGEHRRFSRHFPVDVVVVVVIVIIIVIFVIFVVVLIVVIVVVLVVFFLVLLVCSFLVSSLVSI